MEKNRAPSKRGFTLVEILVVIAIIGVLVAVSIPALSMFSRGHKLSSSGRLFQSAFDLAKRYAVNTRRTHHVLFLEDRLWVYGKNVKTITGDEEDPDADEDAQSKGISPFKSEILLGNLVEYEFGFRKDNYATEHAKTREEAVANLDKYSLEFRPDGTVNFENFEDVPRDYIGSSHRDIDPKGADIFIRISKGETKWVYVDIDPSSARTRMNIAGPLR
ncbi:MAG: pilus assembly FimT family protein [Planctomycetota bacterium]|jgi:prepilin-type N-terminal cleavage/methylation domain-containing protein